MMTHYIDICETLANDQKIPSRIVDWAEQLYDRLVSRDPFTMIRLEDLLLIEQYMQDDQYGLSMIDRTLAKREPQSLPDPDSSKDFECEYWYRNIKDQLYIERDIDYLDRVKIIE